MGGEEREMPSEARKCDPIEGGFSILLGEESIRAFMSSGDFSSAREMERFIELGAQAPNHQSLVEARRQAR